MQTDLSGLLAQMDFLRRKINETIGEVRDKIEKRHTEGLHTPDLWSQDGYDHALSIRRYLRLRRRRDQLLPGDLFADPAWDMLLDLYQAELQGRIISVSSACIASAVPPTTALRWIRVLEEEQLLLRIRDRADGRRVHLELTERARCAIAAWCNEAFGGAQDSAVEQQSFG